MATILDSTSAVSTSGSGQAVVDQQQLEEDLNEFLNLLITQLKNQDPLEPLDTNEFTSQLVEFASVEQAIQANSNLEQLLALQQNTQVASMVNYLGKSAEVFGDLAPLENGKATITYAFDQNVDTMVINVENTSGEVVFSVPGETGAGRHKFEWDGRDQFGNPLPDGPYRFTVVGTLADGTLANVSQTAFGRVTGAAVEDNQVFLFMGDITIPMDSVLAVQEADTPTQTSGDGSDGSESGDGTDGTEDSETEDDTDTTS